jgi:hypothetical protein
MLTLLSPCISPHIVLAYDKNEESMSHYRFSFLAREMQTNGRKRLLSTS